LKIWKRTTTTELFSEHITLLNISDAEAVLDFPNNRVLRASKESWRYIAWRYTDPETGSTRLLPAEHFGPLPGSET
jgi:hypothetical protein